MKSKTSAALMLLLTFVLGAVTGAVSYSLYRNHAAAAGPGDIVDRMAQALQLTPDQKAQLIPIINQSRERYMALSQQFRPQYNTIRDETRQMIREILSEEQRVRFEQRLKELDRRSKPRR
jgi:Spy/CpxP family protein refolding chaperone